MREPNEEQKLAIYHPEGVPGCVLSGAGSGKTFVMSSRVKWLISRGVDPRKILVVTFTNKAANELIERLGIKEDEPHPRVGTIHSLALALIRKDPKGFGLTDRITTLDEYDQKVLIQTVIDKLGYDSVKPYILLPKLQYHRARGVGFRINYTPEVHTQAQKAYSGQHILNDEELKVWENYEKEKSRQGLIDFDDMIHLVVRRGEMDEKWVSRLQKQFNHILMDEAQDTNSVQWKFINLLFRPDNHNAFVVGDLSQSIYGFAGASPETLFEFTKGWRGKVPKVYKIARNHRSVPEVVALANRIQKTMSETIPLKMESWRGLQGDHGVTGMMQTVDQRSLAASIAASIHQDRKKESLNNFAILVRSGGQVKDLEPEMVKLKIPYIIRGAQGFLQTEEVRDVLSYMRIAVNPRDYPAFKRSCTTPKRGVGEVALEGIRRVAEESHDGDLLKATAAQGKLLLYLTTIASIQEKTADPLACLEQAIKKSGYEKHLESKYGKDKDKLELKMANLNRLRETFETLSQSTELSLEDIIFQLVMNGDKDQSDEGRVVISTIHSSKGLEWKKCFIYGVYEGQMPHKFSQTEKEVEEERRLFYVACTRAKDHLVLGIPASVVTSYNTTFVAPSRFLFEIGLLKRG